MSNFDTAGTRFDPTAASCCAGLGFTYITLQEKRVSW